MMPPAVIIEAAYGTSQPELLLAISYVESTWNIDAKGSKGEYGPLQLHPKFHPIIPEIKEQYLYADRYLRYLYKRCGPQLYLMCYNAGPRKVMIDRVRPIGYTLKVKGALDAIKNLENRRTYLPNKSTFRITQDH